MEVVAEDGEGPGAGEGASIEVDLLVVVATTVEALLLAGAIEGASGVEGEDIRRIDSAYLLKGAMLLESLNAFVLCISSMQVDQSRTDVRWKG